MNDNITDAYKYSLKKATRHYFDELQSLLALGFDNSTAAKKYQAEFHSLSVSSQHETNRAQTKLKKKQSDFSKAAAFFVHWNSVRNTPLEQESANDLNGVFFAMSAEILEPTVGTEKVARLDWTAFHGPSVERVLRRDPRVVGKVLLQIERWAASQGCSKLNLDLAAGSIALRCLPSDRGYRVVQHSGSELGELRIQMSVPLPPYFAGDYLNWIDLADWYVKLNWFGRTPTRSDPMPVVTEDGFRCTDYYFTSDATLVPPQLRNMQKENAHRVLIANKDFNEDKAEELLREGRDGRANTVIYESDCPSSIKSTAELVRKKNVEGALKETFFYYRKVDQSRGTADPSKALWDRRFNLKYCLEIRRKGVILEIDRQSYIDLCARLLTGELKEKLIFFNDLSTEIVDSGTRVFFYVWDAVPENGAHDVNGVIAASGVLAERPVRYTHQEARDRWSEIGHHTIWPDADEEEGQFTKQYFDDSFVALTINNLEMFVPGDVVSDSKSFLDRDKDENDTQYFQRFNGVSHVELAPILIDGLGDNIDDILRYLPNWEVGSSFISNDVTRDKLSSWCCQTKTG